MIGIDLQIPGFGSNNSTNCATTNCPFFISRCKKSGPAEFKRPISKSPWSSFGKIFSLLMTKMILKLIFHQKYIATILQSNKSNQKYNFQYNLNLKYNTVANF